MYMQLSYIIYNNFISHKRQISYINIQYFELLYYKSLITY